MSIKCFESGSLSIPSCWDEMTEAQFVEFAPHLLELHYGSTTVTETKLTFLYVVLRPFIHDLQLDHYSITKLLDECVFFYEYHYQYRLDCIDKVQQKLLKKFLASKLPDFYGKRWVQNMHCFAEPFVCCCQNMIPKIQVFCGYILHLQMGLLKLT